MNSPHHDDLDRAVVGPIVSKPLLEQIYMSVWRMRNISPEEFELRIFMTRELYQHIVDSVTLRLDQNEARLFGATIHLTDGEGVRWWVGVPGFVIPEDKDANPTP